MDVKILANLEEELRGAYKAIKAQRQEIEAETVRKEIPLEEFPAQFYWDISELIELPIEVWTDEYSEVEVKAYPRTQLGVKLKGILARNKKRDPEAKRIKLHARKLVANLFDLQLYHQQEDAVYLNVTISSITLLLNFLNRDDVLLMSLPADCDLGKWIITVQDAIKVQLNRAQNLHDVMEQKAKEAKKREEVKAQHQQMHMQLQQQQMHAQQMHAQQMHAQQQARQQQARQQQAWQQQAWQQQMHMQLQQQMQPASPNN